MFHTSRVAAKMPDRRPAALFFVLLTAIYIAFSPFSVKAMGYTSEQVEASRRLLTAVIRGLNGDFTAPGLSWPRHGLVEPILQLPFVLAGRLVFGPSTTGEDVVLSLQPILASSLLCTILFVWIRAVTGSHQRAALFGFAAGLTTMIWPYAYIGLETTQSLFLMLAAYLALGVREPPSLGRMVAFALAAAIAVSVKGNGLLLTPAVAWLIGVQWRRRGFSAGLGATVVFIAVTFVLNEYWRGFFPGRASGTAGVVNMFRVDGLSAVLNAWHVLAAPNKGLLIYCPVLVLALAASGRAYREDSDVAIFSLLTAAALIAGSAIVVFWADDTWGPRYLHSAIAPLVVSLALASRGSPLHARRALPLAAAMLAGFVVSGLGVLFYYGTASLAATAAGQRTLEDIQHDPGWNPVRLHAVLLRVWLEGAGAGPAPWPPERHRWFPAPGESFTYQPATVIDLRGFAVPQPYVLRRVVTP